MKKLLFIVLPVFIALAAIWNVAAAQGGSCQSEMISSSCTIQAGETFNGSISLVNSDLVIEKGGRVNGSIEALRSNLEIGGWVTGNISAALGSLQVDETAHINGSIDALGSNVQISPDATINGEQSIVSLKGLSSFENWDSTLAKRDLAGSFLGRFIWLIFISLALAALGLVAVLIFQNPAERMAKNLLSRPLVSFGLGLLFAISLPFALVLMSVTIILIPVVLAVILLLPLVITFSWILVGSALSQFISTRLHWDWSPAIHAAAGTLVLTFLTGLLLFIDCVGWIFMTLILFTGLGSFILLFFRNSLPPLPQKPAPQLPPVILAPPPAAPVQEPLAPETSPAQPATPQEPADLLDDLFPEVPSAEDDDQPPAA